MLGSVWILLSFLPNILSLYEDTVGLIDSSEEMMEALILSRSLVTLTAVLKVHQYLSVIINTKLVRTDIVKLMCAISELKEGSRVAFVFHISN